MGSIYIGPNNPKKSGSYDYTREPQDLADAAARAHDKGYDYVRAEGFIGAFIDKKTIQADIHLVRGARKIMDMYEKREKDIFTKNVVSIETFNRAKKINTLFTLLVKRKIIGGISTISVISTEDKENLNKMDDFISLTISDLLIGVDDKGNKLKK